MYALPGTALAQGALGTDEASTLSFGDEELTPSGEFVDEAIAYDWGSEGYGVSGLVVAPFRDDVRGLFKGSAPRSSHLDEIETFTDRFLAALRRLDDEGIIEAIEFLSTEYRWSSQSSGHESRWASQVGYSLVDEIMRYYPEDYYSAPLTLIGRDGETHGIHPAFVINGLTGAISSSGGADILLLEDFTEEVSVESGSGSCIDGRGHTLRGSIECESGSSRYFTILEIANLTLDGDVDRDGSADRDYAIRGVNRVQIDPDNIDLRFTDCVFENYQSGAAYFTTSRALFGRRCRFVDVSCGPSAGMPAERTGALVFDLMNFDGHLISIIDSRFEGASGSDAIIGVAIRGGASDEGVDGVLPGTITTLDSFSLTGCTFACDPAKATVRIGVDSKADEGGAGASGFAANGTGSYPDVSEGNWYAGAAE